jgi:hypothetical protein
MLCVLTGKSTSCPLLAVALVLVGLPVLQAQTAAAPTGLERLTPLIGRWEGTTQGQPGTGTVTREYTFALNSRFIRVVNRSEYPAQEKNPKGEVHQDEGFFSFDRAQKRLVLRQFHVESFVAQYLEDAEAARPETIVFASESIENIPAGYRAKETYLILGADEIEEVFELAATGKSFEVYSRTRLKRIK